MSQKKKFPMPPSHRVVTKSSCKEKIFNLFLIMEQDIIRGFAAKVHESDRPDAEKLRFLQLNVDADFPIAERFPFPSRYQFANMATGEVSPGLQYHIYMEMARRERHLELFEEVFQSLDAPDAPLTCITTVVDGKPVVGRVVYGAGCP